LFLLAADAAQQRFGPGQPSPNEAILASGAGDHRFLTDRARGSPGHKTQNFRSEAAGRHQFQTNAFNRQTGTVEKRTLAGVVRRHVRSSLGLIFNQRQSGKQKEKP